MSKRTRHDELFAAMEASLLGARGVAPVELRKAAIAGKVDDAALQTYVSKVQAAAYTVTADELKALQSKYSDDQLFDVTLCAGYGAAKQRHEAAMKHLDAAWEEP
ncbi:MAG: hypothetical protein QM817_07950 [Archangium sp.]